MKTMTRLAGIAALVAMCSLSAESAVMEGSKPKEWPADPASHVVKIERTIIKADDAKWITAAESIPADATAVLAAARQKDVNAIVGEKQWWYMESSNVNIPHALTGEAVTYYADLVTDCGKRVIKGYLKPGSHFTYKASVSQHAEFTLDEKNFKMSLS